MNRPPRPPKSGLLDQASARFILATGIFKGGLGISLLVFMPALGYGLIVIQTVLFLYESVGKLVSVYPSRRHVEGRRTNWVLHVSIALGIGLQILTLVIPGLRRFLGLASLDAAAIGILAAAVVVTWAVAAVASRVVGHTKRSSGGAGAADVGRAVAPALP